MEQLGALHVFELAQQAHHLLHIVAIERSEVADVHALEDVLLMTDGALDGVVQANKSLPAVFIEVAFVVQPARGLETKAVVGGVGIEIQQVFLHAAHGVVDAHIVIVEDDEQVVGSGTYVVDTLESQSSAHGSVANDGYNMALAVAYFLRRHSHSQRCRDAVAGVPASEGVVFALHRRWERMQSAQLAVGGKLFATSRKNLMAVCLMAHIPHDAVLGRVENIVQSHCDFHHAETGGKVAGVDRDLVDDVLTKFLAHLGQLLDAQFAQVGRTLYLT